MPSTLPNRIQTPGRRGLAGATRRRGTSAVEYALILGLVACGVGVGVVQFGPALDRTFATIERALAMVPGLTAPPPNGPMLPPSSPPTAGPPGLPGPGTSGGGSAPLGGGGTSSF